MQTAAFPTDDKRQILVSGFFCPVWKGYYCDSRPVWVERSIERMTEMYIHYNPGWHVMRCKKKEKKSHWCPISLYPHHPPCSTEKGIYSCQSSRGLQAEAVINSVNPLEASLWNINHSFTSVVSWDRETHKSVIVRQNWTQDWNLSLATHNFTKWSQVSQSMWCNDTNDPDQHVALLSQSVWSPGFQGHRAWALCIWTTVFKSADKPGSCCNDTLRSTELYNTENMMYRQP